jgi:hypothetical protein
MHGSPEVEVISIFFTEDSFRSRTFVAHTDSIRDANGVVLPPNHALLLDRAFHRLAEIEQMHIARVPFPPDRRDADLRALLHRVSVRDTRRIQHGLKRELSSMRELPKGKTKTPNRAGDLPELRENRVPA